MMQPAPTYVLTIDTATPTSVIGLFADGLLVDARTSQEMRRADDVLAMIADMLTDNRVTVRDLTQVIVRRGSGSYTGLRVGVTIANTLGWSLAIPVIGVLSRRLRALTPEELLWQGSRNRSATRPDGWLQVTPSYQAWHRNGHSAIVKSVK